MAEKIKVQELHPSQELLMRQFNDTVKFGRFGDVGCLVPMVFQEDADNYRNMAIRPDDVWVTTFPRSGTTWTQELVWLIKNDCDFDTASKVPLTTRYMFLEVKHSMSRDKQRLETMGPTLLSSFAPSYEAVATAPSPRFIKSHLHLSLLPRNLLDTAKVVYVGRDPRDVAVSYYHHAKLFWRYSLDFKSYWNLFVNDLVIWSPFFPHLKEAWTLRRHPNMLFLFYEDMKKDLPSTIKKIADFLGKDVTDEKITKLCEHVDIQNFKENKSVNPTWMTKIGIPSAEAFVRKGKSGGWREYFDDEMAAQAQRWMRDNLADTDLRFPDNSSNVCSKTLV